MLTRTVPAALLLVALTGCSGSGSDQPAATPAPTTTATTDAPTSAPQDDLETAVRAYSAAFLSGDGAKAYALLSSRCRDRTPLSEFAAITEEAKTTYGPQKITSLDLTENGDQAQATYGYSDASLNQDKEPWVNEAGWRNDDC